MGQIDSRQRFGERADLVDLDQQRIGEAILDALPQPRRVGDEQIVAHQLHTAAKLIGEDLPAVHIVFAHPVLDGEDRIIGAQAGPVIAHLRRRQRQAFAVQVIGTILEEFGGSGIERQHHVVAGLEAGLFNGGHDEIERGAGAVQIGREAAFIAHRRVVALRLEFALQRVEDFGTPAHGFGNAAGTHRHHHEFLHVDRVIGMGAAVDDVHHRHRQQPRRNAANIAVQRQAARISGRLGNSQGNAQNGVGAEPAFVGGAVQFDHGRINRALFFGFHAGQRVVNLAIHGRDGLEDALAQVTALVAIAQLHCFMGARRRARRHGRAAGAAIFQHHVHFHGRIAAAVEDFAGVNVDNRGHGRAFPLP